MIDKKDVISFFDKCADTWDAEMIRNDDIIEKILSNACVVENKTILDVACGTGVLFDDYLRHNVAYVTGVDISPEMVKRAAAKCKDPRINLICADIDDMDDSDKFDVVMLYNAFPHFPDPDRLIKKLSQLVNPGGHVSVAHGMSMERINFHHSGSACFVSNALMDVSELKDIMSKYLQVDTVISDDSMYQVCGSKKRSGD